MTEDRFPTHTQRGLVYAPEEYTTDAMLARARTATEAARTAAEAIWTMCQITRELRDYVEWLLEPHEIDDWSVYAEEMAAIEDDLDLSTLYHFNASFITWLADARGGTPGPTQSYARNLLELMALDQGWMGAGEAVSLSGE